MRVNDLFTPLATARHCVLSERWRLDCTPSKLTLMQITFDKTVLCAAVLIACAPALPAQAVRLDNLDQLDKKGVKAETVQYRGKPALRLMLDGDPKESAGLAVLRGVMLRDGTIELEVAGAPEQAAAAQGARGFIGVAFHMSPDSSRYEQIYLRPTNGRADDQVRRNHSVQYQSIPDYPWPRLRKEEPEKYETYVDLEPGVWTKMKIVVEGTKARLYVHGASEPTLIVNDLKLGATEGAVALWIGPGTHGHFANLRISR
ncbi:MAG TPA: hypothetical protein VEQ63_07980 [Bryobacteraceae bacterium]|nr:hypothetical protein [Bryobacteraceae bacterium]